LGDFDNARANLDLASLILLQLKFEMPRDWSARISGLKLVKHLETLAGQKAANGDVDGAIEIGLGINQLVTALSLPASE